MRKGKTGGESMKKYTCRMIGILAALSILSTGGFAEDFQPENYSYEELQTIIRESTERLAELDRQYAIEHADRKITFGEEEQIIYLKATRNQQPEVEVLSEEAPGKTRLKWSSSEPEIARVDAKGTVTAVAAGDAVITATAEDNPYIFGSYTAYCRIPVETITVWGPETPLLIGNQPQEASTLLGYSIEPEDAYLQSVRWSTSDEAIATVDENGTVTGLAPGTAVITATAEEDPSGRREPASAKFTVTVQTAVASLEVTQPEMTIPAGGSAVISTTILPEDAGNRTLHYISSDPEIATVDESGTVTAAGAGTCDITISTTDGTSHTASCRVTVTQPVTAILLNTEAIRMGRGETRTIEATVKPENASNKALIWTSSNMMVARVANGTIEAAGPGECEITCAAADGSGTAATMRVQVPMISVPEDSYTVSEKAGILIPVKTGKSGVTVQIMNEPAHYTAKWTGNKEIAILPMLAGEETLILGNPENEEDTIQIRITIEDSAVYNQNSYPVVPYNELSQRPDEYEGTQMSVYGRVLTNDQDEEGNTFLMVGTSGEDYSDQVIEIKCGKELQAEGIETETLGTFYGIYKAQKIYSEALGTEYTMPGMEAEKIVIPEETEAEAETEKK